MEESRIAELDVTVWEDSELNAQFIRIANQRYGVAFTLELLATANEEDCLNQSSLTAQLTKDLPKLLANIISESRYL